MISFSPKALFQASKERREAWHTIASNHVTHLAIAHAQAQMARDGFGPHEMNGANAFITTLLNMSEDIQQLSPLPARRLNIDSPTTETK